MYIYMSHKVTQDFYHQYSHYCEPACASGMRGAGRRIAQTPGQIQNVDAPQGSAIYTIGVLESKIGGSTFWDPPGSLGGSG